MELDVPEEEESGLSEAARCEGCVFRMPFVTRMESFSFLSERRRTKERTERMARQAMEGRTSLVSLVVFHHIAVE
jgi:cation transport regulator ChaC